MARNVKKNVMDREPERGLVEEWLNRKLSAGFRDPTHVKQVNRADGPEGSTGSCWEVHCPKQNGLYLLYETRQYRGDYAARFPARFRLYDEKSTFSAYYKEMLDGLGRFHATIWIDRKLGRVVAGNVLDLPLVRELDVRIGVWRWAVRGSERLHQGPRPANALPYSIGGTVDKLVGVNYGAMMAEIVPEKMERLYSCKLIFAPLPGDRMVPKCVAHSLLGQV